MKSKFRVALRYCGGCNPCFDRVAAVNSLKARLPGAEFVPVKQGEAYDAAVVVAGCGSDCAGTADIKAPSGRIIKLRGFKDVDFAKSFIEKLMDEGGERFAAAYNTRNGEENV